ARGDIAGLAKVPVPESRIVPLAPFVDVGALQKASGSVPKRQARAALLGSNTAAGPVLLAVGMMRHRAKLESYRLLAGALKHLADLDWTLVIVGDGPARPQVEALFAGLPAARVRFLGAVPADAMAPVYRGADIFTWPGVNEAYGMVYLEAQSCGLPVVATASGGVANVVRDATSGILVGAGQTGAYRDALERLIIDAARRRELGGLAARFVAETHSLEQAGRAIGRALERITFEGKSKS
ncbi:MAG: glycosyltransferase family 4 protein, partial [Hyphomicrobiales bacterium]